ncbi:MAG TPA: 30S ribosomal protein S20 [Candidatus Paceibacterota bacterium]|nr:30S ribosomal protein S20 [Candidatus Paceibacterota bacterium]
MPITKSAKKAMRQSLSRKAGNLRRKNTYKDALKELSKVVSSGNKKEAEKLLPKVYKALDKAAKTKVINKNKASRLKSKAIKLIKS